MVLHHHARYADMGRYGHPLWSKRREVLLGRKAPGWENVTPGEYREHFPWAVVPQRERCAQPCLPRHVLLYRVCTGLAFVCADPVHFLLPADDFSFRRCARAPCARIYFSLALV